MKRIKLKESDLRKIVQRTINESQLLLEEEAICDRGAEQCSQCREVLIKAGVGGAIRCVCHGQGCHGQFPGNKRRAKKKCRACVDDYYDYYDAGNPQEPLYGLEAECGGKILRDVDVELDNDKEYGMYTGPEKPPLDGPGSNIRIKESDLRKIVQRTINESQLNERVECWDRGRTGIGACRVVGGQDSSSGCMSYTECVDTEPEDSLYDGGNNRCIRHNGNQNHGYKPGVNRCLEWAGDRIGSPVDWWEEEEMDTIQVRESELVNTIEKIVKEQMMLGFGNTQGIGLGIAKPSDKYDLDEEELDEDDTTGTTYNVNIANKSADPDYTADAMGIFENISKQNLKKYMR